MSAVRRAALFAGGFLLSCPTSAVAAPPDQASSEPDADEEEQEIIVQATRAQRRVQDEPVRVEVLDREEIEEKILMRPGNIAMVLSETGGLRVQVTAPALGAANIRVQGLDGRYTQILADGLPLYGGQAPALGLLQIPPTDLGQVEVIKGAASALYGASALGGVINLVSRRPRDTLDADALLNATSRDGQDATAYVAGPLRGTLGGSITAGAHRQRRADLDADGWIDIPGYDRATMRSRLFWGEEGGATGFVTLGLLTEDRRGGTLRGRTTPDGNPFPQGQDSDRLDGGLILAVPVTGAVEAQLRASGTRQKHQHLFGPITERDRHATLFTEASLRGGSADATSWVGGIAYQVDRYRSHTFPAFDYTYRVPGLFGQAEQRLAPALTLAGSARIDRHNVYGTQFSPRLSLLYRPGPWTIRASGGRGFYAPTPFVEEIEAAGLSRLDPLGRLQPESARTASLDIGYAVRRFEANATLFASRTDRATRLRTIAPARVELVNVAGARRIAGVELLLRYRLPAVTLTGSYVQIDATEPALAGGRRRVPLTPRHSAGFVAMWEKEDRGRLGFELYYTGRQALEDNPYRTNGKPYFEMGLLGEIVVGRARLFLNAENILNVRQTRFDPLLLSARAPDGRWTVDVWAPTEGFVLNGGVRLRLGRTE